MRNPISKRKSRENFPGARRAARRSFLAGAVESLEGRAVPAVLAFFSPVTGALTISGDNLDNSIQVGRNAAGQINVNGGAVAIVGGVPTVANVSRIQVFGQIGNDNLSLNEANGALPNALFFGGSGSDTIVAGSGSDQVFGQAGNDTLLGKGGLDLLFGGEGNDVLTGGDGDDLSFGEAGDDRIVWNPGDDTDLNEGGSGADTIEVNGGNGAEAFTLTANGTRLRFDRVNPAPFSLDIGTAENLVLNANGGDDTFAGGNGLAALIQVTVDGGAGNDVIRGGDGDDVLLGGDGNDFVDGGRGNDVAFLGAGDDTFQWDPGEGSDTIEGQAGFDTMLFNGANISEVVDISANGGRVRFSRNVANIVMDLNDVEGVDFNALGGADAITVGDLSGTDVTEVNLNLAAVGGSGDGQADAVILNGTNGIDIVDVFGSGSSSAVVGLPALVNITDAEGANDSLAINGLGGNDGVSATTLPAGVIELTVDGGTGNDTLLGSQGADVFLGGEGNDFVFGDNGNDLALLGTGNDVFQWDPGDGNDTIEGQAGLDTLLFFGSNASENIDISANGGRVRFFRDVANVTMDLDDVESLEFRALGGADNIVVGDLSGTDATLISLDLRGAGGGGDGQADAITVNATQAADTFGAAGDAGGVSVFGLQARVNIFHQEQVNDRLTLNGLGGADVIDATSLEADGIQLIMNGGLGADLFLGSEGDDLVNGGDGNDVALLGAGDDTFVWNPGDDNDTIEGQAGFDTMLFNGANVSEVVDISANGGRVRFSRNVANVTMDLNDVEGVDFNALGGADAITVGDLSGTDVTEVNLNLAGTLGGPAGDGQFDSVIVNGTNGADVVVVSGDANGVAVVGLAASVNITGFLASEDSIRVNTLAGDDVVEASGLAIPLVIDGGADDDVLIGGSGNDIIFGGDGDDVLLGGPGLDVLDGGTGDNIAIQG